MNERTSKRVVPIQLHGCPKIKWSSILYFYEIYQTEIYQTHPDAWTHLKRITNKLFILLVGYPRQHHLRCSCDFIPCLSTAIHYSHINLGYRPQWEYFNIYWKIKCEYIFMLFLLITSNHSLVSSH